MQVIAPIRKLRMTCVDSFQVVRLFFVGVYHSVGLVASLYQIAQDLDMKILSHVFSEPQFGKVGFAFFTSLHYFISGRSRPRN